MIRTANQLNGSCTIRALTERYLRTDISQIKKKKKKKKEPDVNCNYEHCNDNNALIRKFK